MIVSVYIGVMVLIGAGALGWIERALSPDQRHFPCVNETTRTALKVYTLALAWAAFDRLYREGSGSTVGGSFPQAFAATALAAAHVTLLVQVVRLRLPSGTWARLLRRHDRVRQLARQGAPALAKLTADPAADLASPPSDLPPGWLYVLRRLAARP